MIKKLLSDAAMKIMVVKGNTSLRRLKDAQRSPFEKNKALLLKIVKDNRNTEFGKAHHFDEIRSLEDYRKFVPPSVYEDYAPMLERVKNGEKNVLTSANILGFSRTSGSSGVPKYIPATDESLKAYVRYTWTRALALSAKELKRHGKSYKPGRGVFLSPATNETLPNGMPCSNIAEIGAREYGRFYPYILTVPTKKLFDMHDGDYVYEIYRFALADEDVSFIFSVFLTINVSQLTYLRENWKTLVDDITNGTISDSVDLKPEVRAELLRHIKPMPERGEYLRKQFEQGFDETILKRVWPNLTVICGIGNASFKSAADYVRSFSKGVFFDFSIYGASEALVAAVTELETTDMQLLIDSCFYEFVNVDDESGEYLTLDQLKKGEKYEILITTSAGLYRYRLKDVIVVTGFNGECPLISFVRRKGQLFNIAGEKFSGEDARCSVEMFEKAHGIILDNWLFYQDESVIPNRYAFVTEEELPVDSDTFIDELEGYMGQCNKRYESQRAKSFIGRLTVQKLQKGTHAAWAQRCVDLGASAAQIKPVHSLDTPEKKDFYLSKIINL
ncbi:MAG: GH3 auxin-responsive promoter family protein [Clostridiales bacterium]|nr:GH3 auxin-responsive promoter family protein [Clostridiales bacterium]